MNRLNKQTDGRRVALTGGLCCIELTKPMIDAYNEQLNEILAFHAANFNVRKPIDEQMKKLAFDDTFCGHVATVDMRRKRVDVF